MGNGASVAAGLEVSEEWQALHKPTRKKVENLLRNQQQKIEQLSGQVLESLAKTPSKQVRDSRVPHLQKKLAERNAELKALRAALENPNKVLIIAVTNIPPHPTPPRHVAIRACCRTARPRSRKRTGLRWMKRREHGPLLWKSTAHKTLRIRTANNGLSAHAQQQ